MPMSNFDALCRVLEGMDPETYDDLMVDKTIDILAGFSDLSEDTGDCLSLYGDFLLCSVAADGVLTEEEFLLVKPVLDRMLETDTDYGEALDYFHETGLDNRAESKLLDKSVEAAKLQLRMKRGENLPSVSVGAGYLYHDLLEKDTDFGVVFASVSVPITSWWGGSHAIKREKIKKMQTENTRQDSREMMLVEIEAKWNDLQEAYQQVLLAQKSIESATENLRLNNDYYKAGTVALSDLLDAQSLMQQSHDQYAEACTSYQQKQVAYMQATGR